MRIILISAVFLLLFTGILGNALPTQDIGGYIYSSFVKAAQRQTAKASVSNTTPVPADSTDQRLRDLAYVRQQISTLEENMQKISEKNQGYFKDVLTNFRNDELILSQGLKNEDIRAFNDNERRARQQQQQQNMNDILASNRQRTRDQQEQFYRNLELHQARMANQLQRISDMRERSPITIQRN